MRTATTVILKVRRWAMAEKQKENRNRKEKGKSRGHGAQVDDAFALS